MANEAILRTRFSDPINFGCTETAMEKGTILKLSGARSVGPTSTDGDVCIGVLAREKIAGDGRTQVAVFVDGIFDVQCDHTIPAIALGSQVGMSGANVIKIFTAGDSEDGTTLGNALEANTAEGYMQVMLGK